MATLLGSSVLQFPSPPRNRSPSTPANGRTAAPDSSPGQVLASSPLLRDDTYGGPRQNVVHSSGGWPSIQVDGAEDIGWEGGEFGADNSDYRDSDPRHLGTRSRSSTVEGDLTDSDLTDGQQVAGESPSYGALSRRAESILRNAKAKLNLLDTNLKGARHSLATPSGTNPTLRSSSSASMHLPTISSDEEEDSEVYPSRPSSNNRAKYSPQTMRRGHNRVFSETSVPSDQGLTTKGSRNMDYTRNRSYESRSPSARARAEFEGQLGPVLEDEPEEPQDIQDQGRNRSTSVTKDLRAQADDLRQRLSFLQARARDDTRKRNSHRLSSSFGSSSEVDPETFNTQVRALEQSLQRQEQVIAELESAEVNKAPPPPLPPQDPRTEWSRVIDHQNQVGIPLDGSDGDEEDEDDIELEEEDDMDHENFQDVLKMKDYQDDEEEDENLDRPHEERADVFDYETFILHSTMGTYEGMRPQSISGSSASSHSTPRGDDEDASEREDDNSDDEGGRSPAYQQPNDSVASFETAHSQRNLKGNGSSSDADSEDENDEWPMPPRTHSGDIAQSGDVQHKSREGQDETKIATTAVSRRSQEEPRRPRPTSAIFAALTTPEQGSSPLISLDEKDTALLYSLAENLRNACLHIQESSSSRDSSIWRDRLEQARQILGG